ncbi:hypothetical protein CQ007_15735 [Pseudomonas sp. MYb185]|nr:hypothetical protein CQ007_15735 [Pseudomonas sp. MYb185]
MPARSGPESGQPDDGTRFQSNHSFAFPYPVSAAGASDSQARYTAAYCPFINQGSIMKRSIAAFFVLLSLAGCGQKGPLYMPEETAAQPVDPAREELIQQPTEN